MIKAVLFDADGVLLTGERFSRKLAKDYGISTDITEPFFKGPFKECIIGNADLKELLPQYLQKWGWQKSVDDFLDEWFESEHKIDEQLVQYIQDLRKKGIKCYLATNQEKYRVQYMLDKMGFSECFDKVYASSHLGHRKPAMEFYSKVVEDLGLEKSQILFWDDTSENIDAANQFGLKAELYTSFEDFKDTMNTL